MDRKDFIILYLSLSLFVIQFFYIKEAKEAAYFKGRAEVLEVMAEINYEQAPYTVPSKNQMRKK